MKKYIIVICSFIICTCNIGLSDELLEINAIVLQDIINPYLSRDKSNIITINIKFDESKASEQFNDLIHKVKFPGLILKIKDYDGKHFDSEGYFVDSKGRRMVFFKIYKPQKEGKLIRVTVDFDKKTGSHGCYDYFLDETETGKYKLVKRELVWIT